MPKTPCKPNQVGNENIIRKRYQPSEPCSCDICISYCERPGWWTVSECRRAYNSGLWDRMMLEISPERTFGVLSPAFKGCEGRLSLNKYARNKCTFLKNDLCELFGTGFQPLECRFCHHERINEGVLCHSSIEESWRYKEARLLVRQWCRKVGLWDLMETLGLGRLKSS